MEQIYFKDEPTYSVVMNFFSNKETNKSIWKISFYDKKNEKELILDQFEVNEYREPELYKLMGDIRKSVIIGDVLLVDESIFIIYCSFHKINFVRYQIKNRSIAKSIYFIEDDMRGSFANFGDPKYTAKIELIAPDYLGIIDSYRLCTYNYANNLFLIISFSDIVNEINYLMPYEISKSIPLIEQNLKTVSSNKSISILNYMEDYESEISSRRKLGFIYFFYENNKRKMNIIRYNNYNSEWLIGDYEEIEIKSKK